MSVSVPAIPTRSSEIPPSLHDAHQDHRVVAEVVWQTFRSTTIVEYEIPKYEGITEQSNLFVSLTRELCERKVEHFPGHSRRR